MSEINKPPPSRSALAAAAAAGGFGGAVLGVVAATSMMGNGDEQTGAETDQASDTRVAVVQDQEQDESGEQE